MNVEVGKRTFEFVVTTKKPVPTQVSGMRVYWADEMHLPYYYRASEYNPTPFTIPIVNRLWAKRAAIRMIYARYPELMPAKRKNKGKTWKLTLSRDDITD